MDLESQIMGALATKKEHPEVHLLKHAPASYFHLSVQDKADYIALRLKQMESGFLDLLQITAFQPVTHSSFKPFYTFGMVVKAERREVKENSPDESKSNREEFELYLENTIDQSNVPIKLNLDGAGPFSLFEGQCVAVKARNPQGNELLVDSVYTFPVISFPPHTEKELGIAVSRGPYTESMLSQLVSTNETILILLGPFTSTASGFFLTLSELKQQLGVLLSTNEYKKVLLVPSLEDYAFLRVFPQPVVEDCSERIIVLPNPGLVTINGHLVTIINLDIFSDMAAKEMVRTENGANEKLVDSNILNRLASHAIFQGVYSPVFPSKHTVAYGPWLKMDKTPHLFITQSEMGFSFTQVRPSHVLCIGSLSSTYARLEFNKFSGQYNASEIQFADN